MPFGEEMFLPGALRFSERGVFLDCLHQREKPIARTDGGGLTLVDTEFELRFEANVAKTQVGKDTLELVRRNILRGSSVEFVCEEDEIRSGVRVIKKALLTRIGVVDVPAYENSTVNVRSEEITHPKKRFRYWY